MIGKGVENFLLKIMEKNLHSIGKVANFAAHLRKRALEKVFSGHQADSPQSNKLQ